MRQLIALAALLLLTGCTIGGNPDIGLSGQNPLSGTAWKLDSHSSDVRIRFLPHENAITGWTGCNTLAGSYSISGDRLSFTDLEWTEAGCPSQEMFNTEQTLQDTLDNTVRWESPSDHRLILTTKAGNTLHLVTSSNE